MDLLNMVKFQLKIMYKNSAVIGINLITPILLTLVIGYLTKASFGGEVSSYEFYSIGMMCFAFLGAGIGSAFTFLDKPYKAGNIRSIYTPVKTSVVYVSQIITGTILSAAGIIISILVFKLMLDVDYNGADLMVFFSFLSLSFLSNAIAIFLCTIMDNLALINNIFNIIQAILCILGGAFFSLETLGEVPAFLAKLSPVKWLIDGLLNSIYDNSNSILYIIICINIVLALIIIGCCRTTFKTEKYI